MVCLQDNIPNNIKYEKDWRILKFEGPLDFSLIGILSSISTVLAERGISIFAVSICDTDYILVKAKDIINAVSVFIKLLLFKYYRRFLWKQVIRSPAEYFMAYQF